MSTIGELKTAVKRHLTSNMDLADLFQGEADAGDVTTQLDGAILTAANNARVWAERRHDFSANWLTAKASLTPGSFVSLDTSFVDNADGVTSVKMRTLENVFITADNGSNNPLHVTTRKDMAWAKMKQRDKGVWDRYPGDEGDYLTSRATAVVAGRKLWIEPEMSDTETVYVEGYKWMDAYTDNADTDFLLVEGFDFMMWAAVVEVNHMILKFVPRQEGTLAAPVRLRDEAWDGLILNDSHSVEGNIYHDY